MTLSEQLQKGAEYAEAQTTALCWLELRPLGVCVRAVTEGVKPARQYRTIVALDTLENAEVLLLPVFIDNAVRRVAEEQS